MTIDFTPVPRDVNKLRPNAYSIKWINYDKTTDEYKAIKKDIQERGLHTYPKVLPDETIIDGITIVEIYKELFQETGDPKYSTILTLTINDVSEVEIPQIIRSFKTRKELRPWEKCEMALACLPPDAQGKDLGGNTKWELAIAKSRVTGVSPSLLQDYDAIKNFHAKRPEKKLLDKVQNLFDPMKITTARKLVDRTKEKENRFKNIPIEQNYVVKEPINVADSTHFVEDNYQLYNQSNRNPWIVNDKIQLLFFSPPYLNQRHYEDGKYVPEKLDAYLQKIYFAVKEGKKHLSDTGIVGINIGEAYNFGANYITLERMITKLCDKLGLYFFYKMIWHKKNSLTKGREEGKFGRPLYNYEEILFFCQNENYQFEPIKYYRRDKEIEAYKMASRLNSDGTMSGKKWVVSKPYEVFDQFIDEQLFHDVVSTEAAKEDSRLFNKDYGIKHPAIMPLVIPMYPILCFTKPGQLVADCYAGSGTTLVTALLLGRKAFGIEAQEKFFNPMQKRIVDTCNILNPHDATELELKYLQTFHSRSNQIPLSELPLSLTKTK